jgi:hypothetical protein
VENRVFWGDIHVMNGLSAGLGTLDETYVYARDIACLDFASVTNHDTMLSDEEWDLTKRAAINFNESGRFVTLSGYEYSETKYAGHKNVYYLNDDEPMYRCTEYKSPDALWAALNGKVAITIPHHPARPGPGRSTNWDFHNQHFQRLVEIYSCWGSSEYQDNPRKPGINHLYENHEIPKESTVQAALERGYKLGIIASSDTHSHHAGYGDWIGNFARRRAYHGGLVAVLAPELNREEVWKALWDRRCYGTTGSRIIINFEINNAKMGSEIESEKAPNIKIEVIGSNKISKIETIRNNEVINVHRSQSISANVSFIDNKTKNGNEYFYYIRVTQIDEEIAWSSPIWVKMKKLE